MEASIVDEYEHRFGKLIVNREVSKATVFLQRALLIFLGGFLMLAGFYIMPSNIPGGLVLIILGLAGSTPMLMTPGGRREVRVYEEGFVSIQGKREDLIHFSEVSSIGHELRGVYGRQPIPKIRLKNREKPMSLYVPIQGEQFDWFLKLGHAYATWLFRGFKPEKLKTMNLSFGSRLVLDNSDFICDVGRPRATKWHVSEIQDVTISPKSLDFQLGNKGCISLQVDKIENFHIIPYIVESLNSL